MLIVRPPRLRRPRLRTDAPLSPPGDFRATAPGQTDDAKDFGPTILRELRRLNQRLDELQQRLDNCERQVFSQADSDDLIELRLHSARVAAEMSRVTVELRSEIETLAQQLPSGRSRPRPASAPTPDRAGAVDKAVPSPSGVVDLTERRARQTTGWLPLDER